MQFATKTLVASMYGVAGDAKYGMYHPEIAAITHTSSTLHELMDEAGPRDSRFYTATQTAYSASYHAGKWVGCHRQDKCTYGPDEVEFEKWCSRMILVAEQIHWNTAWTDGSYHDPTLYVKGIELKQSRMPPVMGGHVYDNRYKWRAMRQGDIQLSDLITNVVGGNVDPTLLCMKGKLVKDLSQYKVLSGPSAGAGWANEFLGKATAQVFLPCHYRREG